MATIHAFAPALGSSSHVLEELSTRKRSKRQLQREDDDTSETENEAYFTPTANSDRGSSKSRAGSYTFFTANQLEQFRTAGLEPGDDIPKAPFPHRSNSPPRNPLFEVHAELQQLSPPLAHVEPIHFEAAPFKANEDRESLRNNHLANLTTILHCMLAKQDFHRAGRAWGLLLRSGYMSRTLHTRTGHQAMDVRANERWGIGAEILMRGAFDEPKTMPEKSAALVHPDTPSQIDKLEEYIPDFSEAGFKKARHYYERLIVQYPEHHRRKGAKSSSFYAAMFSLWIFETNERSKRAKLGLPKIGNKERIQSPFSSDGDHSSSSNDFPTPAQELVFEAIQNKELQDAEEIVARLDEVLATPPFDKNAELLQLRGMIALWIGDLKGDRTSGVESAQPFFQRSQKNGGRLWKGIETLHLSEKG
jgi:hypothetical protein